MKVLFCTDGSEISYNAVTNYLHYYAPKGTEIDYICAIDWGFLPDNVIIEESGFVNSCRNIADEILIYTEKIITETGFKVGNRIKLCGSASEGILDQLKADEYQTVILGSHGKKGFQRWLGSVSKDVLDSAETSVYISKNRKNRKRILFATDTINPTLDFAKKFCEITDLTNAELSLITVIENPDLLFADGRIDENWMSSIKTKQEIQAQKAIDELRNYFESQNIKIHDTKIATGIPAKTILENSKETDLIVIGATQKNKAKRFFTNSVGKRVVENTECDVLTIKI